ncbi:MAG: hypothetical protein KAR42_13450 [candidate division Zixibacteria bacterium]|nr:hypothetical protein [candidate division Zixibacteria bacterium]
MRKSIVFILVACFIVGLTSGVSAFDGKRKGFILGLGAGLGLTSYTQSVGTLTSDRENSFGLQTDFKIGLGTSEVFQIYWQSKVSWFGLDNALGNNVTIAHGFGGIGFTYFLQPTPQSAYLTGGLGYSTWTTPFESNSDTWIGFGLTVGAGYELSSHLNLEGTLMFGKPTNDIMGIDISTTGMTIRATIIYMGY